MGRTPPRCLAAFFRGRRFWSIWVASWEPSGEGRGGVGWGGDQVRLTVRKRRCTPHVWRQRVSCPSLQLASGVRSRCSGSAFPESGTPGAWRGEPGRAKEFIRGFENPGPSSRCSVPASQMPGATCALRHGWACSLRPSPRSPQPRWGLFCVPILARPAAAPGPSCPALVPFSRRLGAEGEKVRMRVFVRSHLTGDLGFSVKEWHTGHPPRSLWNSCRRPTAVASWSWDAHIGRMGRSRSWGRIHFQGSEDWLC